MHSSRFSYVYLGVLALPLAVACGSEDGGTEPAPTTTGTSTAPVAPTVAPTTTPTVAPTTTPPVTPTTTSTPPVTPPTPDTWAAVYPIFQAKCESAFCHGPSEIAPQLFGDEATVRPLAEARVDSIAMRTAVDSPRPMPPAGMGLDLTEAEHAAITAWAESL